MNKIDTSSAAESLDKLWEKLESDFGPFNREVSVADNPISAFSYYVEMGKYPPPELMIDIMLGFNTYLESKGDISLDQAFLGITHSKYKSLSFKQQSALKYAEFDRFVYNGDFSSLDEAAELFLSKISDEIDQDSYLRDYRRWKARK
ncbi:hypothetical protein N9R59_00355 [Porticoccaceae bacterium]|nr:hypothetical protein [Porticoccaceae bacterium]